MGTKQPKKQAPPKPGTRAEKLIKVTDSTHLNLKIGAAKRKVSIGELVTKMAEDLEKK